MLPERLLACTVRGGLLVPHFLTDADHPWLRVLLDRCRAFGGRALADLEPALAAPLGPGASPSRQRMAVHLLTLDLGRPPACAVAPRRARQLLFTAAAGSAEPRQQVVERVAASLGLSAADLEDALFADMKSARRVAREPALPDPAQLALRVNLDLARGLVARAHAVRVRVAGHAGAVVRTIKLHGLIAEIRPSPDDAGPGDVEIALSGPLSVFKRTLVYGRAMAGLVPLLPWCGGYRLEADCLVRGVQGTLVLDSASPVGSPAAPRRYDSKLEERFAKDFDRLGSDWVLQREPEPVEAGSSLIFPDFGLAHRWDADRRWLVEIAGYWTPAYVARKLATYRQVRRAGVILCLDQDRNCDTDDLPPHLGVLRFRRRVDAAAVLRLVEGEPPGPPPPGPPPAGTGRAALPARAATV